MNSNPLRIVFMGTPDFAVEILDGLMNSKHHVVGVITAPDKPAGRGQQLSESAVKKYAVQKAVPILQPTNLKDENFISELNSLSADLFVVVAFRMLPEVVWNMPPKGTINLHASLLPQYRGAAPINWAVVNGEAETGVTTFFIEQEIDTGLIIERQAISILPNETAGELHDKLMLLGRELVVKSVDQIANGDVKRIPQASLIESSDLKIAPKIFKPMCEIHWSQSAQTVHNFCRGFSPYPTAWTMMHHSEKNETKSLKIFKTEVTTLETQQYSRPFQNKDGIFMPCSDFYVKVIELQIEGKRKMNYKEFTAGYQISEWKIGEK
ncbi:MAG: methionyl-tRNA formyltransferase [Crocinitomicaceae bacterium]|nr:MAG: methionyl-tRNA formyltransferase [Crocinitomicaceae bacterium]